MPRTIAVRTVRFSCKAPHVRPGLEEVVKILVLVLIIVQI